MNKRISVILFLVISLSFCTFCFAETIILKSGQQIEGKILEKTDKYIKIDFQGVPITYYLDEITSIDEQIPKSPLKTEKGTKENSASESFDKIKIVEEILELSGTKKQIENFPSLVEVQLAGYKNKQKPEIFEIVSKVMSESYKAETMYQVVLDNLIANFDKNHYAALLNWLRSPLSRKMSQLEEQASTSEALQEMREFAAKLQYSPPLQERVALAQALDEAIGGTNLSIEMITLTNLQMYKAFETVILETQRIKEDNWEEKLKSSLKAQLEQPIKQNTLTSFLYIYRSVSDEELREYINFWDSEEGRWCNKILTRAFLDAMAKVGREMGNRLANALPKTQVAK